MSDHWIYINSTLGLKVPVKVPFQTTEDYDRMTGNPGQWREDLAAQQCYSKFNPDFYKALASALSRELSVEIPASTKKDKDGNAIPVSCKEFIAYLMGADNPTGAPVLTENLLNEIGQRVAAEQPVLDITPSSRGSGSKAPKEFLAVASQLMAKLATSGVSLADWCAKKANEGYSLPAFDAEEGYSENYIARCVVAISKQQALL